MIDRSSSPYAYFAEFNRKVAKEQAYPPGNHDDMLSWKLSYQPITKLPIPAVHLEQLSNNEATLEAQQNAKSENDRFLKNSEAMARQYKKQLSNRKLKFIDVEQRKKFSLTKFMSDQNLMSALDRRNISLQKVLSSIPIDKLEKIFIDKKNNVVNLLQNDNLPQQKKKISPIYDTSLSKPLGEFLALVKSVEPPQKRQSKRQVTLPENVDAHLRKTFKVIPKTDNCLSSKRPTVSRDPRVKSNEKFRFRDAEELPLGKVFNSNSLVRDPTNRSELTRGSFMKDRINSVFSNKTPVEQIPDDKRYFFNFKRYFNQNYINGKQFSMKLTSSTQETLKGFEEKIQEYIS